MRATTLIVLALVSIFLLSSCGSLGPKDPEITTEETFKTGTSALIMGFGANSPPNQTYENQTFEVSLFLENRGATEIVNGKVQISHDTTYIENPKTAWTLFSEPSAFTGSFLAFDLKGRSMETPLGEQHTYSKNFIARKLGRQSDTKEVNFIATACYDYQTLKAVTICIDPVPDKKTNKACEMQQVVLQSQGAPLAITKVVPRMFPISQGTYELEVDIYLKNKGQGQIYQKGATEIACGSGSGSGTFPRNFWNVLNADSFDLRLGADNSGLFECSPLPLELTGKEDPIKCIYRTPIKGEQAYTTTLLVDLKYGYSHSTSAKTTIFKRIPI